MPEKCLEGTRKACAPGKNPVSDTAVAPLLVQCRNCLALPDWNPGMQIENTSMDRSR